MRTWNDRLLPGGLATGVTPLTFSVWQCAAARGLERAGRILGVKGVILEETRPQMPRIMGHMRGHAYVNVEVLTALLDLLPFADKARAALACATGQAELVARRPPPAGFWQRQRHKLDEGRWPGQLDDISRAAREHSARYRTEVELTLERHRAATAAALSTQDADAVLDVIDELQDALSKVVAALALSGLSGMLQRVEIDVIAKETSLAQQPGLVQDLLGGDLPDEIADLPRRMIALVEQLRERPMMSKIVMEVAASGARDLGELIARLHGSGRELDTDELRVVDELRALLTGSPAIGELTLEGPRLAERLEAALAIVIRLLTADVNSETIDVLARAAAGARKRAEYALDGGAFKSSLKKRLLATLSRARDHARDTALLLLVAERVVDGLRTASKAIGERLCEHGLLEQPRDVFVLTASEIVGLVRGSGVDIDGKLLVAARSQQAAARPFDLPSRLDTTGIVAGARLANKEEAEAQLTTNEGRSIVGQAVSSRVVDAPALPLATATALAGIVLVKHLSLFDLPLLLAAKAVVAERGTAWSAAAYALRALGIPTVVDVPHAMTRFGFTDSEVLRVDGDRGVVAPVSPGMPAPCLSQQTQALMFARAATRLHPRSLLQTELPALSLARMRADGVMSPGSLRSSRAQPSRESDELSYGVAPAQSSVMRSGQLSDEATDIDEADLAEAELLSGTDPGRA